MQLLRLPNELDFGKGINVVQFLNEQVQAIPKKAKPDLKPTTNQSWKFHGFVSLFEDLNFQIHAT